MSDINKLLQGHYLDILQNSHQFQEIWQSKQVGFSGLFLAGVLEDYLSSPIKILVIGRETRGWGYQFDGSLPLTDYIDIQIRKAQGYLKNRKEMQRDEKGSSFHNFVRQITNQCENSSVAWANLHCYSWKHNRTDKSPLSDEVAVLSQQLLIAQVEILRPHYIIFAHGATKHSVELRRRVFPIVKCETVVKPIFEGISDKQLWNFEYQWSPNHRITCFRILHPASFSTASKLARSSLISHVSQLRA